MLLYYNPATFYPLEFYHTVQPLAIPIRQTGLIGVLCKDRKRYQANIRYSGKTNNLGTCDTKEQAGIAYRYDRFVVDKSTEEVSYTLNDPKLIDIACDRFVVDKSTEEVSCTLSKEKSLDTQFVVDNMYGSAKCRPPFPPLPPPAV